VAGPGASEPKLSLSSSALHWSNGVLGRGAGTTRLVHDDSRLPLSPSMRKPVDVKAHFCFLLSMSLFPFSQAASVAILPSALFCERDKILLGHIGLILLKRLSDDLALLFVGHARWDSQSYLSANMVAFPKWKGESQNDTPLGTGCLVTPSYC
jgi:hypothetical protein